MIVVFLAGIIVFGIIVLIVLDRKRFWVKLTLNQKYFEDHWNELLSKVKTSEGTILAVIDADKLLDEALIKRGYKGKTMGERMVSAQRAFSNNDSVWFAHKLRNRLVHEPGAKLRQHDAKTALSGIKQGLRDLGALK